MSGADLSWRDRGACNGLEPAIFFPDHEEDGAAAKAIWEGCGVRVASLDYALEARERQGIWGGASARERRRIARTRRHSA
jgi:WhiB family redox-sensing transcriptional regulator